MGVEMSNVNFLALTEDLFAGKKSNLRYYVKPCSSFGYYRGEVVFGGDLNSDGYGPIEGGIGRFSQGEGPIVTGGIDIPFGVVIALILVVGFVCAFLCDTGE